MTVFETLNSLNVNEHTEKKKVDNKTELTYLSWPWAWAEVKKRYPDAHYEIKRNNKTGLPYSCDPCTGYMVFTSVTIDGVTHDMWLPVMDGSNNAMKQNEYKYYVKNPAYKYARQGDDGKYYDKYGNEQPEFFEKKVKAATMFDVNKAIMRCLVKNLAMFGLGLYIYAGEDLPECEDNSEAKPEAIEAEPKQYKCDDSEPAFPVCEACGRPIQQLAIGDKILPPEQVAQMTAKKYGLPLCNECAAKAKAAKAKAPAGAEQ